MRYELDAYKRIALAIYYAAKQEVKKQGMRTFTAGGLTITAPYEESLAAEAWIRHGSGAEMTSDRLRKLGRA